MPRRSPRPVPGVPPDLRLRLEAARLDTLAVLRALDHVHVPPTHLQPQLHTLYQLDADCAEALWALDQPAGTLDLRLMARDTLVSLEALPNARAQVRARLRAAASAALHTLEPTIRASLDPREAYNDVPGRDPQNR